MAGGAIRSLLIVELPDEIDVTNCDAIAFGLLAAVAAPGLVIADMTGTAFCDSAAMRMLLAVHDRAQAEGSELRVAVRPGTSVARMMGLLGMNRVLSIYNGVDAALPADCAAKAAGYVRRARIPGVLGAANSSLSWFGCELRFSYRGTPSCFAIRVSGTGPGCHAGSARAHAVHEYQVEPAHHIPRLETGLPDEIDRVLRWGCLSYAASHERAGHHDASRRNRRDQRQPGP